MFAAAVVAVFALVGCHGRPGVAAVGVVVVAVVVIVFAVMVVVRPSLSSPSREALCLSFL